MWDRRQGREGPHDNPHKEETIILDGEADPDAKWWQPLFSYHELAASGGSRTTAELALLIYPFLVPVMLVKSLGHMLSHDPDGRHTLRWVLLVAPLRFAIDSCAAVLAALAVLCLLCYAVLWLLCFAWSPSGSCC